MASLTEVNSVNLLSEREINSKSCISFERKMHSSYSMINRLGLETELEGHSGCVNCLEWSESGHLLMSGSDDTNVIIWDALRHKKLKVIKTGHQVKFIPESSYSTIATGAADSKVRAYDVLNGETLVICSCHQSRVKRLTVAPGVSNTFWSSAEDGVILEFDLRSPHRCGESSESIPNILIDLTSHLGHSAEVKCITVNPMRPEIMAVGANDPYIRLYDRRMIRNHPVRKSTTVIPTEAASYFVAGHLPQKRSDLKRSNRFRSLACTYVAFSADGSEMLANLGGEQIYLFDVFKPNLPKSFCINFNSNGFTKRPSDKNGYSRKSSHTPSPSDSSSSQNDHQSSQSSSSSTSDIPTPNLKLPPVIEDLKLKANIKFEEGHYTQAINIYNIALNLYPKGAVLYGNRAAAFVRRGWDGDLYAALRDCYAALKLEHDYLKVHYKLVKLLLELKWGKEAASALESFKIKYPEYSKGQAYVKLEHDIQELRDKIKSTDAKESKCTKDDTKDGHDPPDCDNSSTDDSTGMIDVQDTNWDFVGDHLMTDDEKIWRARANDYKFRYCGHCNTTTDIKEANFFGRNGQFVVGGSDDGSFFVWDKKSTNIVRVMKGDESIVNCLQPHPTICLLASSGIDSVVRLWSPRPEDGVNDDRVVKNSEDAAVANQQRMNSNPFEVMLMNMGYRGFSESREGSAQDERRDHRSPEDRVLHCRPS